MPIRDSPQSGSREAPARSAIAVTPSDSTSLGDMSRGLFVGGAGNLSVVMAGDGTTVVFTGVSAGSLLPIQVSRVNATGTTATNIVALW